MKTIYEFEDTENPVIEACGYAFGEIEKLLKGRADYDGLIQDIRDKILELKGIMLSECYVPRYIADLLNEAGFNRGCSYVYDENNDLMISKESAWNSSLPEGQVAAPTLQEASRWIREHWDIHFDLTPKKESGQVLYDIMIKDAKEDSFPVLKSYFRLATQEEAIILGLIWTLRYIISQRISDDEE